MVDVIESLRQHFGPASFRPGQQDVVRAIAPAVAWDS
jgi:superfamily II DNA helicase RecQ